MASEADKIQAARAAATIAASIGRVSELANLLATELYDVERRFIDERAPEDLLDALSFFYREPFVARDRLTVALGSLERMGVRDKVEVPGVPKMILSFPTSPPVLSGLDRACPGCGWANRIGLRRKCRHCGADLPP